MTEFEKWVRNNWNTLKEISPCPYSNLLGEGWKAALEWVRDKCCGRRSEGLEQLNEEIIKELEE